MKKWVILLLLLTTACAVVYAQVTISRYRDAAMRTDSLYAANDTARVLELRTLSDSVTAMQLRIVQTTLERDSVDRELRLRPVVRVRAGIQVDTLRMTDTVEVPTFVSDTVKAYDFEGEDGPFAFHGNAQLFPSDRALFNVNVNLTRPIPVSARISCGSEHGIRSASLTMTAENPFTIRPESVFQEPGICNPQQPVFSFSMGKMYWAIGGGIVGAILANWLDDKFHHAKY